MTFAFLSGSKLSLHAPSGVSDLTPQRRCVYLDRFCEYSPLQRMVQILNEEAGILLDEARHSLALCGTINFVHYTSCTNSFQ